MCYDHVNSLPGYAIDPNNCAKYYSCAKYGGKWVAYHMNCSDCTFFDSEKKTCAWTGEMSCLKSVSVATDPGVTSQRTYDNIYMCIDATI